MLDDISVFSGGQIQNLAAVAAKMVTIRGEMVEKLWPAFGIG
jgi:hypothetical protein